MNTLGKEDGRTEIKEYFCPVPDCALESGFGVIEPLAMHVVGEHSDWILSQSPAYASAIAEHGSENIKTEVVVSLGEPTDNSVPAAPKGYESMGYEDIVMEIPYRIRFVGDDDFVIAVVNEGKEQHQIARVWIYKVKVEETPSEIGFMSIVGTLKMPIIFAVGAIIAFAVGKRTKEKS